MVRLLDCTLRDGGYVNNWEFGFKAISDIICALENVGVDILELGFIKDEVYNKNRTVFGGVEDIAELIPNKKPNIQYAAMIEVINPIPLEKLPKRTDESIDIIRVIIWKTKHDLNGNIVDALQEGFTYCKGVVERGYKLFVQPARVDQYTDAEFVNMLKMFQQLNPEAIYIVDSWGTCNTELINHYMQMADRVLKKEVSLGYHGHNNMMQAFRTAADIICMGLERDIIVDASVYGIGRGAGNLNIELYAEYLNEVLKKNYNIRPILELYEKYIKKVYDEYSWGYSIPYYLSAKYKCNPRWADYYGKTTHVSVMEMEKILAKLSDEDKVMFSKEKADELIKILRECD